MVSAIFYIIFGILTGVYFLFFCVVWVLTVPFDRNRVAVHWFSRMWTKCYFALVPTWRVRVEGLENIDRDKAYVIIVNHRSMLDIILMYVLPLNFRWVAKKEVYKWPIFGWVLSMHGDITIERGTSAGVRKLIKEAGDWLGRGVSVIIFPEGSRSKDGEVHKFHEGAFMMARQTGAAILPCAAVGTGTATHDGKINFRNLFKVKVLPPVPAEEVARTPVKEMAARMQELVTIEYEKLRKEK